MSTKNIGILNSFVKNLNDQLAISLTVDIQKYVKEPFARNSMTFNNL
jgi:hypothetical protein